METIKGFTPELFVVVPHRAGGFCVASTQGQRLRHPTQGHVLTFSDLDVALWHARQKNEATGKE